MSKVKAMQEMRKEIEFDTKVSMAEELYELVKEVNNAKLGMVNLEQSIMREESENIQSDVKYVNDVLDVIHGRLK